MTPAEGGGGVFRRRSSALELLGGHGLGGGGRPGPFSSLASTSGLESRPAAAWEQTCQEESDARCRGGALEPPPGRKREKKTSLFVFTETCVTFKSDLSASLPRI